MIAVGCLTVFGHSFVIGQTNDIKSLSVGSIAPTFYLQDLEGNEIFLSELVGKPLVQLRKKNTQRTVILSFFATWCVPCKDELPELERIYNENLNSNLSVFLIDVQENEEKVGEFLKSLNISLPVLMDKYGITAEKYGVVSLPMLFIIDKDGIIRFISREFKGAEEFREKISEILSRLL